MPWKARHFCDYPGCPELVAAGEKFCANHKKHTPRGDSAHYDRRWQKIRALFLAKHPLCADCQAAGRLTPATELHHIVAVNGGGSDRDENLQALCKSCHSKRTWEGTHG
ncbi:MAG: HNH endonuclease [Oscillospiraceae bacterium]|jgi:5-methylcytosine-specific restriction protein A|nr:HNH endonuclease [Oscillospiraceae bacterium]